MRLRMALMCGLMIVACVENALGQQRPGGNGPLPGDPGYGRGTSQQEIPPPPPRPTGEWIKTWGSIANGSNGEGGVSVGLPSKAAAENEAIKQCIRGGGLNCKSTFSYHNQCVAILTAVSNPVRDTIQGAESVEAAKKIALPVCKSQNNGSECEVAYSACSEPIFKRY
jgi:hypothetical protein